MGLKSVLLLALCARGALSDEQQLVWGSVVFTYHGEKMPYYSRGSHHLTPLGAQQAYNAGQVVRERYISPKGNITTPDFAPINGISQNDIINSQLDVLTTDDEYMTGSSTAFMQGLYPPNAGSRAQPLTEEYQYTAGLGSLLQYPLDGYQYPDINTVNTDNDFDSIFIAGHLRCDAYSISEIRYKNTSTYQNRVDSTRPFYQGLRDSVFANVPLSSSSIDFRAASHLHEYALYEYNHNNTIYNPRFTTFRAADLSTLYDLASEQQFAINSPNSMGSISTIAGRTLAGKVFQQFEKLITSQAYSNKLSLMFTSFEPFLSFFALSGLSTGPSASIFKKIPAHGSVMAFEIFSYVNTTNSSLPRIFPERHSLYVRFMFRNGTDANSKLVAYPLFGNSPSTTELTWYEFAAGMDDFAMFNVQQWCSACSTTNLFCVQIDQVSNGYPGSPSGGTPSKKSTNKVLPPAVYGAIGAVIALAVIIAAFILLAVLGFRLEKTSKKDNRNSDLGHLRTTSGNGGFKGAEKLASDTDLRIKGGAGATVIRHERVGSWELNDAPKSPISSLDKDLESGRVRSTANYDRKSDEYDGLERVNPFGDPVKPRDHI